MTACPRPEKVPHKSRGAALTAITSLTAAGRGNPDLQAYRCPCGAWHVGHSSVALRKRIHRALSASGGNRRQRRK